MRIDCPFCGRIGTLYAERIIRSRDASTTYYCSACESEWDEDDDGVQTGVRRFRPPKTHTDKTR